MALPAILQFLDVGALGTRLAALGPLLILGIAVVFVIGALYRYGPHREMARKRWVTLGAVAATVAWVLASFLLSFYISNFANFNKTYGSLGAIAALMFWFYVSAFVVLLGAELNAEMELQSALTPLQARRARWASVAPTWRITLLEAPSSQMVSRVASCPTAATSLLPPVRGTL